MWRRCHALSLQRRKRRSCDTTSACATKHRNPTRVYAQHSRQPAAASPHPRSRGAHITVELHCSASAANGVARPHNGADVNHGLDRPPQPKFFLLCEFFQTLDPDAVDEKCTRARAASAMAAHVPINCASDASISDGGASCGAGCDGSSHGSIAAWTKPGQLRFCVVCRRVRGDPDPGCSVWGVCESSSPSPLRCRAFRKEGIGVPCRRDCT